MLLLKFRVRLPKLIKLLVFIDQLISHLLIKLLLILAEIGLSLVSLLTKSTLKVVFLGSKLAVERGGQVSSLKLKAWSEFLALVVHAVQCPLQIACNHGLTLHKLKI